MMRTRYAWLFVGLLACTKAGSNQESASPPEPVVTAQAKMPAPTPPPAPPAPAPSPPPALPPEPAPPPPPPKAVAKVTVQMTAATLADDCGGSAPRAAASDEEEAPKAKSKSAFAKADRSCDQTSMQLSVKASAGGSATKITVKKVELFDDKGVKIGTLTPSSPTMWTKDGAYKAWDQTIAPGQELSVSYALSQPAWGSIPDRRNRTYVLKAVVTVGAGDQVVKRDVHIAAPTSLPPGVKT